MRRLFFTFAHGPPGIGLLLLRLLAGTAVAAQGATVLTGEPPIGLALVAIFLIGSGLLLIVGLWTPLAAGSIAAATLWYAFAHPVDRLPSLGVGVLGLAIALLGPGAWSVDARLFGWKRVEIPDRTQREPPP